jgi:hypothetical protein
MPQEEHEVKLIAESARRTSVVITYDDTKEDCTLALRSSSIELSATADDYFEALCAIRWPLELLGLKLDCYGASRNVFPSPLSRQMGGGLRAYRLRLGIQARTDDLVFIFDTGEDVEPVSVDEQRSFYKQWLESIT